MFNDSAHLSGISKAAFQPLAPRASQNIQIRSVTGSSEAELSAELARIDGFLSRVLPRSIESRFSHSKYMDLGMRRKWAERLIEGVKEGKALACVAEQDGQVVGLIEAYRNRDQNSMEFATIVADRLQGQGMGKRLRESLEQLALQNGVTRLTALPLDQSRAARSMESAGYRDLGDGFWVKDLGPRARL